MCTLFTTAIPVMHPSDFYENLLISCYDYDYDLRRKQRLIAARRTMALRVSLLFLVVLFAFNVCIVEGQTNTKRWRFF